MPLLARILAYFYGNVKVLSGPYALGKHGIYLHIVGLIFLLFTCITFNFPTLYPVDQYNMNYTSAAIGVIGLISIVTWFTTGKKNFTGPQTGIVNVGLPPSVQHTTGTAGDIVTGTGDSFVRMKNM